MVQAKDVPKPAVKTVPITDLDNLRSVKDKELAQATKRAQEAQVAMEREQARAKVAEEQLEQAKLSGLPPEEVAQAKQALADRREIAKRLEEIAKGEVKIYQAAKEVMAKEYALEFREYGVTQEELLASETPEAMRIMALERQNASLSAKLKEQTDLAQVGRRRFETGEPLSTQKSIAEMSKEEFAVYRRQRRLQQT